MRTPLPQRRHSITRDLLFNNVPYRITVGFYDDHVTPGEVFITSHKAASDLDAAGRDNAILLSMLIQHGVPLAIVKDALTRNEDGSASSLAGAVADMLAAGQFNEPASASANRRADRVRQIVREELAGVP